VNLFPRKAPASKPAEPHATNDESEAQQAADVAHLTDSGRIEVALALAAIGFVLVQFGTDHKVRPEYLELDPVAIGKVMMFTGIAVALLLHVSFWLRWTRTLSEFGRYMPFDVVLALMAHLFFTLALALATLFAAAFLNGVTSYVMAASVVVIWFEHRRPRRKR
jgi:hypothetical protein